VSFSLSYSQDPCSEAEEDNGDVFYYVCRLLKLVLTEIVPCCSPAIVSPSVHIFKVFRRGEITVVGFIPERTVWFSFTADTDLDDDDGAFSGVLGKPFREL
jgi:hypothetical protein